MPAAAERGDREAGRANATIELARDFEAVADSVATATSRPAPLSTSRTSTARLPGPLREPS